MDSKTELGKYLKLYLQQNMLTINDLAQKMSVPHSTVSRWVNGRTQPSLPQLAKLASATSTDLCYLVGLIYPAEIRTSKTPEIIRLNEEMRDLPKESLQLLETLILGLRLQNAQSNADKS